MASKTPPKPAKKQSRPGTTFEMVKALCPSEAKAERMHSTFGHEPVDYAGIRENTEEHVVRISNELCDNLNSKALQIFLQRLVGAFVNSAYSAAKFYSAKYSEAMALYVPTLNYARSEDSEGIYGFETKAQRTASFAAEVGLQAYALMAAAEGACSAYEHVIGEVWQPFEPRTPPQESVSAKATAEMMAALRD